MRNAPCGHSSRDNPKHALQANAHYWLGETFYVRRDYQRAAYTFADSFQKYPEGNKAADNLLKLGMSLGKLGKKKEACTTYSRLLENFPKASSTLKGGSLASVARSAAGERATPPPTVPDFFSSASDTMKSAPRPGHAIGAREFDALMRAVGPFEPCPTVAVAVSGGAGQLGVGRPRPRLGTPPRRNRLGLTVDHRLRPRVRARSAAGRPLAFVAGYAPSHLALGPSPARPRGSKPRRVRRAMPCWTAGGRRHGVLHLLLAHHRDDQAETS